ncbi:major facilitator superfamily multidrug transporter [Rhodococcus wratislaviensis IFP 2016]|nr:major facilitator superfamily multidrug transporter [Rhodococcus wratislaviensis IFP 2016]
MGSPDTQLAAALEEASVPDTTAQGILDINSGARLEALQGRTPSPHCSPPRRCSQPRGSPAPRRYARTKGCGRPHGSPPFVGLSRVAVRWQHSPRDFCSSFASPSRRRASVGIAARAVLRPRLRLRAHPRHRPDGRGPHRGEPAARRTGDGRPVVELGGVRLALQPRARRRGHRAGGDVRRDGRHVHHGPDDPRGVRRPGRRTRRPRHLRPRVLRRPPAAPGDVLGDQPHRPPAARSGAALRTEHDHRHRVPAHRVATHRHRADGDVDPRPRRRLPRHTDRRHRLAVAVGEPLRRTARPHHHRRARRVDRVDRHRCGEPADLLGDHRRLAAGTGSVGAAVVVVLRRDVAGRRARLRGGDRCASDQDRPELLQLPAPADGDRDRDAVARPEEDPVVRRRRQPSPAHRPAVRLAADRTVRRRGAVPPRAGLVQGVRDEVGHRAARRDSGRADRAAPRRLAHPGPRHPGRAHRGPGRDDRIRDGPVRPAPRRDPPRRCFAPVSTC